MDMALDDFDCACGHVEDEHNPRTLECDVEDCDCIYFDNGFVR